MINAHRIIVLIGVLLLSGNVLAQIPVIQKVELLNTYPQNKILITGAGFSSTPANLVVWFDQVKGAIVSSSLTSIEVTVPVQAPLNNIEVLNLTSKASAKSSLKFMPSYSGEPFNATKFTTTSITSSTEVFDVCSCDFNVDGKPDLVSTKSGSGSTNIMLRQNTSVPGTISFVVKDVPTSFQTDNAVCGDLNGDGKPELVLSKGGSTTRNSIHIFRNNSAADISFLAPINLLLEVEDRATRMKIFDLNRDGKPEIVVTNTFNNTLYIFQNTSSGGTLSFNTTPIKITVTGAVAGYGVEVQDFNGDGLADIALTDFQRSNIFLLRNSSSGTISFAETQVLTLAGSLNSLSSADFNADGKLDLVVTSTLPANNKAHVLLNTTANLATSFTFSILPDLLTTNGPWGVDVSDIDGDKDPDILIPNRDQAMLNVFLHNGNFATPGFTRVDIPIPASKNGRNVRVADFDGDAKPDFAVTTFAAPSYFTDIFRNANCHQPVILNDASLSICSSQTIRLKAIPAVNVTYTWKNGATTVKTGSDAFYDATTAGTYTVVATGEGGACALTSNSVVISSAAGTVPADPAITAPDAVCVGNTITMETPAITGAVYTWTGPASFSSAVRNPSVASATINKAGFYSLQVTVGSCKSNVVSKRIDVVDLAEVSVSSTVASNMICQGNSLTLSVDNDPAFDFQWQKDGIDIVGQTSNSYIANAAGSYRVRIDNTAVSCSQFTQPVVVKVLTPPVSTFSVNKTSACMGEELSFSASLTGNVDANATPVIGWAFGDGNTSTEAAPTHKYLSANTFTPTLTVSYFGVTGCSNNSSKSITITNSVPPLIVASATTICPGEESTLSIGGSYTSITWSTGGSASSITVNAAGEYSVETLDASGCTGNDDITINSKPIPNITATAESTSIEAGSSVQLEAFGGETYTWEPAETLNNASISAPIATPLQNTTYVVKGSIANGCPGEASVTINIKSEEDITIKPLPAFSPNGDGSNEVWVIEGAENYPGCTLSVFDGRGRRVFEKIGYASDWDGTYNGKPVPTGTYYYVFGCDGLKPATGSVLIFY